MNPRLQSPYASCRHAYFEHAEILFLWLCLSCEKKIAFLRKDTHLLVQGQLQAAVFLVTPKCVHCHLLSMRLTACQNRKSVKKDGAPSRANAKFALKEVSGALPIAFIWLLAEANKIQNLAWLSNAK